MGCPSYVVGSRADFCEGRLCWVLVLICECKEMDGRNHVIPCWPVDFGGDCLAIVSLGLKRLFNFYVCKKNVLNERNVFASTVAKVGGDSAVGSSR
jgi:hypothetical protein